MNSKEALRELCARCEKGINAEKTKEHEGSVSLPNHQSKQCPFRAISGDYCELVEAVANDLEILWILKKRMGESSEPDGSNSEKVKRWLEH